MALQQVRQSIMMMIQHERITNHLHLSERAKMHSRVDETAISGPRGNLIAGGGGCGLYLPSETFGMKDHLRPEGKPAPPRPRKPEFLISLMIQSSPLRSSSFVLYQSPYMNAPLISILCIYATIRGGG
jgi:hypothetical protein